MAETDLFPLTPDYDLPIELDRGVIQQTADSGRQIERVKRAPRRIFRLQFRHRRTDDAELLRDWVARFSGKDKFFRFDHPTWVNNAGTYLSRSFPVQFLSAPREAYVGNERYDLEVELLEAVGKILPAGNFPNPATGHPSFFLEEDVGVAVAGTWTLSGADANFHPPGGAGKVKENANTNTTDQFRWTYAAYGFRLWAPKGPTRGIFKVKLDGVDLGNVDQYNASIVVSAVLFTKLDVPLGLHTVDIFATNTKNISATGQLITADALEAIP